MQEAAGFVAPGNASFMMCFDTLCVIFRTIDDADIPHEIQWYRMGYDSEVSIQQPQRLLLMSD